jgi:hypothetical protein
METDNKSDKLESNRQPNLKSGVNDLDIIEFKILFKLVWLNPLSV